MRTDIRNVYIAGPMRGFHEYNFPAFDRAAELARDLGFRPFNPADMDRAVGIHEHTDPLPPGFTREAVLRDIAAILACDAIAMLPGWEHSTGARAEKSLAEWLGLAILDAESFLPLAYTSKESAP